MQVRDVLECAGRGPLHERGGGRGRGGASSLEEFKQPLCYVTGMEMTSSGNFLTRPENGGCAGE